MVKFMEEGGISKEKKKDMVSALIKIIIYLKDYGKIIILGVMDVLFIIMEIIIKDNYIKGKQMDKGKCL